MPHFARYIGIDYSGAVTPELSCKGIRVFMAEGSGKPEVVQPPPSPRRYWTRQGLAEWLRTELRNETHRVLHFNKFSREREFRSSPMTTEKEVYPHQRIYERDNFKCRYCGWDGRKDFESWFIANFNVDHIKPKSLGGTDDDDNLVLACRACNLYKGKFECNTIDDAIKVVNERKAIAEAWYRKHVLKLES